MPKVNRTTGLARTAEKPITTQTTANAAAKRSVVYPQPSAVYYYGDDALTQEQAKEIMGWRYEEELEEEDKLHRYLLVDLHGKKVWCINNFCNRPFIKPNADQVKQEILRRRWKFNHESAIIGKTAKILSAQHRLIGFILACQEIEINPDKWEYWEGEEPRLEILISYGCDEDDATVNTIDTGRPRSLSDVIYRSEYFNTMSEKDRRLVSRVCEHAVKMLWFRTGAGLDAFAPKRTHAESLNFIERHPQLLKMVKHVYEENDENQIGRYLSPGYAAGIMYLMSVCGSDPATYKLNPEEDSLNWDYEDKALEFWTLIGTNSPAMQVFHKAMTDLTVDSVGNRDERLAIICKAWNMFVADQKLTKVNLSLAYWVDLNGFSKLGECPTVGGIDQGNPTEAAHADDPDEDEIAERMQAIRTERQEPAKPKKKKTEGVFEPGDEVWVIENPEDLETAWKATIVERMVGKPMPTHKVSVAAGFAGAGSEYAVLSSHLSHRSPFEH